MNRRRVRFAPSTAAGSSSSKIGENKRRRKSLHVKGLLASFVAAVLVFQLYATLKQPSAGSSSRNAIGTPLVGMQTVAETALGKAPIRRDSNQHASSSVLQPLHSSEPSSLDPNYLHWLPKQRANFRNEALYRSGSPKVASTNMFGLVWWITRSFGTAPLGFILGKSNWSSVIDALASTCTFGEFLDSW
jgi:hypothetical protein